MDAHTHIAHVSDTCTHNALRCRHVHTTNRKHAHSHNIVRMHATHAHNTHTYTHMCTRVHMHKERCVHADVMP